MKKLSKEECEAIAKRCMKNNGMDECFVAEDGNVFKTEAIGKSHCRAAKVEMFNFKAGVKAPKK